MHNIKYMNYFDNFYAFLILIIMYGFKYKYFVIKKREFLKEIIYMMVFRKNKNRINFALNLNL